VLEILVSKVFLEIRRLGGVSRAVKQRWCKLTKATMNTGDFFAEVQAFAKLMGMDCI
jgi:hypothetical protein